MSCIRYEINCATKTCSTSSLITIACVKFSMHLNISKEVQLERRELLISQQYTTSLTEPSVFGLHCG